MAEEGAVEEEKNWWQRIPSWWRTPLLAGGIFFAAAVLLGLWVFEKPRPAAPESAPPPTVSVAAQWMDLRPIVVIDAGHGGHDPGAVNAAGTVTEAEVTQELADRLAAYLQPHEFELITVQAHAPGEYLSPKGRADVASALGAALFLSLHLNADFSPLTHGFQCFPPPPGRVYHSESTDLAGQLTEQMRKAGADILGENGIYYAYYEKLGPGNYQKQIIDSAAPGAEETRADESFGVLEYGGCPTLLAELWHISSPADMVRFNNEDGKDAVARALYLTVCGYLGLEPQGMDAA